MNPRPLNRDRSDKRDGSLLFYVMGIVALLALFGLVSVTNATLESRSAFNKIQEVRALFNASAGVEMVKNEVEAGLNSGQSLDQVLGGLSVSPPSGDIDFDTIDSFRVLVPNRIFEFTSTGRSGEAEVAVSVQFRRRDIIQAGVFGVDEVRSQPNVSIYGYSSMEVSSPSPADDNGGAAVGSNGRVDFGNNLTFSGTVLLGETEAGATASCVGCYGIDTESVGHVDPDPLGANNNGQLAQRFAQVRVSNDNALNPAISGTVFSTRPGESVTFITGNYYLTEVDTGPRTEITILDQTGPVRFFVDGEVYFAPDNGLALNDPFSFQIYSISTERIRIQPKGDLSAFVYAPNAEIGLWPNGNMLGTYWGRNVQFQPGGDFYVDTSLQDRILSNELEVHAWFEERSR